VRRIALSALAVLAVAVTAATVVALWPGAREARGAAGQRSIRLVLHWKPQAQFAGYYVAAEKGMYAARGLDVTVIPGGPDIDSLVELREGRADFALAFLSGALSAYGHGDPIVNVCQVINRSNLLLVAWRDKVDERADLNASRVTLWGMSFRAACDAFFSAAAVHPRLLPQYYTVNLFLRGGADACSAMEYNEYHTILMAGVDPDELKVFPMREYGLGFPEDGVYTLAATEAESPELCADFAAATMEGWEYCRDHPDEALDIVLRQTAQAHVPTNRVHQSWMLDRVLASIFPGENDAWQPGKLARVDYERTRAIMIGQGQIETGPAYDAFVAPGARSAP
jgi:NitT/TauT family transport system substrate-binding protein